MRGLALLLVVVSAAQAGSALVWQQTKPETPTQHRELIEFIDKTRVFGVVLEGKYIAVHDDEKMAAGEPCFYIYPYAGGKVQEVALSGKPLVAFHCRPVERKKAQNTVMTVGMTTTPGIFELREIQFAGSTKGHGIPSPGSE